MYGAETFKRAYKRTLRKHFERVSAIDGTLTVLATDPFDPRLETHKLKGRLTGAWACRAGYDLRIVFDFVGLPGQKEKDILPDFCRDTRRSLLISDF